MTFPLITCGLTAYNAEDTLSRALDSIFSQTWQPFEVVAVDDCSSDGTWKILEEYAKEHSELRIYRNSVNGGVAVSRNCILAESQGDFVAFFDDDDVSLPERLVTQYQRIVDYEQRYTQRIPIICHTARMAFYPNGKILYHPAMGQDAAESAPSGLTVSRHILQGFPLKNAGASPTCCQMARLSTYRILRGFDPEFRRCEDTELSIRLGKMGGCFLGIAAPLVKQTMTKTPEKNLQEEYIYNNMMLKKHRDIMNEKQYVFCCQWIDIKFTWLKKDVQNFLKKLFFISIQHPVLTGIRFINALPNIKINMARRRFYKNNDQKAGGPKKGEDFYVRREL
jgi:glycosyltransferase involved in cell wall biosynthesis